MDLQLFSIDQVPRSIPVWDLILDDLGRPSAERIGKALDIGRSTVYRWNQTGKAPKVACLALFWLTRWGRSEVDCRATNDAMTAVALARSLHEDRTSLRAELTELTDHRDHLRAMLQRALARGSASSASPSRTGMDASDWPALATARLDEAPRPHLVLDGQPPPLADRAAAHRGSPEAQPPGAHSARCPDAGRSRPPLPSTHQESAPSSPCEPPCYHSDASMASSALDCHRPERTCFRWDKPRAGPAPLAPQGAQRGTAAARQVYAMGRAAEPGPATKPSRQGAQAAGQLADAGARVEADQDATERRIEVARPADAAPLLRGLHGPSDGAEPHAPAPRAPAQAFAAIAAALSPRFVPDGLDTPHPPRRTAHAAP